MELLQIHNLSFSYEENKLALCDISVKIKRNEKIAVLGPNGAGKSTFFLILNGVREKDLGDILLNGEKIVKKTRNKLRKSVGIVFQDADSQIIGGGSDDAGSIMIEEITGSYEPWFTPILEKIIGTELPGEVESLFFCLQTGIGVGVLTFCLGRMVERKKWIKDEENA